MPQVRVNKLRMQFDKLKTQTRKLTKSLDGMKTDLRDLEVFVHLLQCDSH